MNDPEVSTSDPQHGILTACRHEVANLRQELGWDLLPQPMFEQQTYNTVLQLDLSPRTAAMYIYSPVLYAACADLANSEHQNAGFTQTFNYMYAIISKRSNKQDYAREIAQDALTRLFYSLPACQNPQTFLAAAICKLASAITANRRAGQRDTKRTVSLNTPTTDVWDQGAVPLGEHSLNNAREAALAADQMASQSQLQRIIRELIVRSFSDYPRARRQLVAFWLKHWDNLDAAAIGKILRISPESVYALCSRAKRKLETDKAWLDALADTDVVGIGGE